MATFAAQAFPCLARPRKILYFPVVTRAIVVATNARHRARRSLCRAGYCVVPDRDGRETLPPCDRACISGSAEPMSLSPRNLNCAGKSRQWSRNNGRDIQRESFSRRYLHRAGGCRSRYACQSRAAAPTRRRVAEQQGHRHRAQGAGARTARIYRAHRHAAHRSAGERAAAVLRLALSRPYQHEGRGHHVPRPGRLLAVGAGDGTCAAIADPSRADRSCSPPPMRSPTI